MRNALTGIIIALGSLQIANAAGTTAASFLTLGAGARAAGMGEAFASIADDVTATYWNPAGLSLVDSKEVAIMQNDYLVDTSYQYVGAALPLRNTTVGFALYRMDYGSIDGYNAADEKQGSFDANSLAAAVSLGGNINANLHFGFTAKYIKESIENESASSFAGDLGFLYQYDRYNAALTVTNLGPGIDFVQEKFSLPQTVRVGGSGYFLEEKLLLSLEVSKAKDDDSTFHSGLEFQLHDVVALRGGYQLTPGSDLDLDGSTGLTGGIGINYNRFAIDYAIQPFGDLDISHSISLLIKFAGK